ncbi:MAG: phosphoglycerate dehydrogenase [Planctomycetota bacterium]
MKIAVLDKIGQPGLEILRAEPSFEVLERVGLRPEEILAQVGDWDAIVVRSGVKITAEMLEAGQRLRVVGRAGIGVDNIDVEAASRLGIVVMNTPDSNAITTAELTLSLMMALARKIPAADASLRAGLWERSRFLGSEVFGKTLGVVGLGRIGSMVAERARGLGMRIVGYDPYVETARIGSEELRLVDLDEVLRLSDFLTVHTPLNDKTRGLINADAIQKMKDGARIINVARGGIIDEVALQQALESGKLAGAAIDVFVKEPPGDHPLLKLDNVVATPHLGASTEEAQEKVAVAIAEQIKNILLDGTILNAVNVPSVSAGELERLRPYLSLCERLGAFCGQTTRTTIRQCTIEFAGEVAQLETAPLTQAVLKGLLAPQLGERVNAVNARLLAGERGLRIAEVKMDADPDFNTLVTVSLETDRGISRVAGTLLGRRQPRLVRIDDYLLDALPEGTTLVTRNADRPGVIGAIGTLLGQNDINISRLQLGLQEDRSEAALAVINIDGTLTPALLEKLRELPHILSAEQVVF